MNAPTQNIQYFSLDAINLSDMNPRQDHDGDEINALALSIAVAGLIQPLACYCPPDGAPEVVDGGRRWAALKKLRADGVDVADPREPDWDAIPCVTTTDAATARMWAGAAAASFIPLSPTQEIRAYAAMADQGSAPDLIARAFAVTTQRVKQRLRLANLSTATLNELSAGNISLDVAKALTLAPTQPREIELLDMAVEKQWGAHSVRMELERNIAKATDRRAIFVGLDAYTDAGGAMAEDLFGEHTMLQDTALLDKLFKDKLDEAAATMNVDWKWAEPVLDHAWVPSGVTIDMTRVRRTPGDICDADQDEYDRLSELSNGDVIDKAGLAKLDALQMRLDGDWTDDEYATCGVFVFVDNKGLVQWDGAWLRKADQKAAQSAEDGDDDAPEPAKAKPTPQNAVSDFGRIAHAAAQTAALKKHDTLLYLLAFQMQSGLTGYRQPLSLSIDPPSITPEKDSGLTLDSRLSMAAPCFDAATWGAFQAFIEQGPKHRNEILTRSLARSLTGATASEFQARLIESFQPNIRAIWTPDAANCFGRLSPATLDQIWAELVPAEKAEALTSPFEKLNKGNKAKELEKLFCNDGYRETLGLDRAENATIAAWVPAEMRGDSLT